MSEPLSTTEIEDVLSSIRRLVAQDLRPNLPPKSTPGAGGGNKLLLTPALRVVTAESDANRAADMAVVVSNLGSRLTNTEWETDADDVTSSEVALVLDRDHDGSDDGWVEPASEMAGEVDEIIGSTSDEDIDLHRAEVDAASLSNDPETTATAELAFVSVRRGSIAEDVPSWAQSVEGAEDEIDNSQTEIVAGTIEPDPAWADAAEADIRAELEKPETTVAPPPFAGQASDEESLAKAALSDHAAAEPIYDEALLREIVRDLLREELQGAMGERITRNIRKLVRSEFARAIATQDLT